MTINITLCDYHQSNLHLPISDTTTCEKCIVNETDLVWVT